MPKNDQIWPKIGIFGQFGPGNAGLFSALLVGRLVVVARGLYLARHLFTLWFSYNFYGFQAIWLTLKQDPRAGKARATLDREVNCQYYLLGKHKRDLIGEQS